MWFRFRSCRKCHGDLVLDGEDWKCWQCGRYYYSTPPATDVPAEPPQPSIAGQAGLALGKSVTGPRRRRSERNINAAITATSRSEFRWWNKNREVIKYLDEGRTVKEIANLIDRGQRQIRIIRERLNELRETGADIMPVT